MSFGNVRRSAAPAATKTRGGRNAQRLEYWRAGDGWFTPPF